MIRFGQKWAHLGHADHPDYRPDSPPCAGRRLRLLPLPLTAMKTNIVDRTPLVLRLGGVAALAVIFYTHLVGIPDAYDEVFWVGLGYTLICVACAVSAVGLLLPSPVEQRRAWWFGGLTALLTLTAYAMTRTVGLPQMHEDKGNWSETYGVWSTIAEASMIMLAAYALFSHHRHGPPTTDMVDVIDQV